MTGGASVAADPDPDSALRSGGNVGADDPFAGPAPWDVSSTDLNSMDGNGLPPGAPEWRTPTVPPPPDLSQVPSSSTGPPLLELLVLMLLLVVGQGVVTMQLRMLPLLSPALLHLHLFLLLPRAGVYLVLGFRSCMAVWNRLGQPMLLLCWWLMPFKACPCHRAIALFGSR